MRTKQAKSKVVVRLWVLVVLSSALVGSGEAAIFSYDPITEPIISAKFSVDFAALVAHRTVSGYEVNFARLLDMTGGLGEYDLSDDLFGMAAHPDTPLVNMGDLETGIITADIDVSFFPALAGGDIGLNALFTDTDDAMFAIDYISLTIETNPVTIESFYGWPVGNENNGFGIGLADGANLPAPLPDSIPIGATGTGFDETESSKRIPEPMSFVLLALGSMVLRARRKV